MVARGAGDVGCAHCTLIGADRACLVCTHLVCETCAADWATCSAPSGRVVRLGLTARVRDVDPTGRLAFVTHWRRKPRLFDLRQLRWVRDVQLARGTYLWNRKFPPRLTRSGRLICAEWSAGSGYERSDSLHFDGMRVHSLRDRTDWLIQSEPPLRGTAVSALGDYFYFVTDSEKVGIVRGADSYSVDPLPRRVVHALHIDGERDLLAVGAWSEVVTCGLADRKLWPIRHRKTLTEGIVTWIEVAGPWLVAAVESWDKVTTVEVWRLGRDFSIGPLDQRHEINVLRAASLSRDGRYLALGADDGLHVHELATESVMVFDEHTDRINYVRFASDHTLISADTDNRVVMRPRTPTGYARPLIAIDVPEEGVELPSFDHQHGRG